MNKEQVDALYEKASKALDMAEFLATKGCAEVFLKLDQGLHVAFVALRKAVDDDI